MEEYFKLFHTTFDAIKEVDGRFRVGGPAVCGGTDEVWIKAFMEYCHENRIPVDFVTRHNYTIESPERIGHYGYTKLQQAEEGFVTLPWRLWTGGKWLHSQTDLLDFCFFQEVKGEGGCVHLQG